MRVDRRQMRLPGLVLAVVLIAVVGAPGGAPRTGDERPDPEIARLTARARRALDEGYYSKAAAAATEALQRTEAKTGADSPETAEALDLMVRALANRASARDPLSMQTARRAVELKRKLYGNQDPRYAVSLDNQAVLLVQSGAPGDALGLFAEALRITETELGPHHPQVATILSGYADAQCHAGDCEGSMAKLDRALAILEAAGVPDTLEVTMIMNRKGLACSETGDFVQARAYLDTAIALREAHYGPDHPRVTGLVNNLAQIYDETGDEAMARQLFRRVLESLSRTLDDPDDVRIGVARLNLAVATRVDDPRAAEPMYREAMATFRKRLGDDHELLAKCLLGLGAVHRSLGDLQGSMTYYEQALEVFERTLPAGHPQIALALRHIAALDFEAGRLDTALAAADRALVMASASLGPEHPEVAEILALRGALLAESGARYEAIESSLQAENIASAHLRLMARGFAERDALVYAGSRPRGLDVALQLASEGVDAATQRRVWDAEIRSRSLVLDEMVARSRSVTSSHDPEVAKRVAELRRATMQLTRLVARGPGDDPEHHARDVATAGREKEAAERALAAKSAPFSRALAEDAVGVDEVAASLPHDAALVAFVAYEGHGARKTRAPQTYKPTDLLALVVDGTERLAIVPIGTTHEVESLVARWRHEVAHGALAPDRTAEEAMTAYLTAGEALREVVWDPIARRIGEPRQVFLVPEGALHTVSFLTLPLASDRFLIDAGWCFHYLATERDLVPAAALEERGEGLLAVGDVDFDAPRGFEAGHAAEGSVVPSPAVIRGAPASTRDGEVMEPGEAVFSPLPGTGQEAANVIEIWTRARASARESDHDRRSVTYLTGAQATEGAFKAQAGGKRVLHLATHGFFGSRQPDDVTMKTRGIHAVPPRKPAAPPRAPGFPEGPSMAAVENPLRLSGLALAGVNHQGATADEAEDGLLTVDEVAVLDLHGVEVAVLSGCDTGVGEVQAGEGVLGLRRAFRIAGARSLVISLWAVSDQATIAWMQRFYERRFAVGSSIAAAVTEASRSVLATRRRSHESVHPFYWGAFVAAGDWQ